jgi:hypothetical protein
LQFGSDADTTLYRTGSGVVHCSGFLYGESGLGGGFIQTLKMYASSNADISIETRPLTTRNIVFKSAGTTPTETMRCNSSGNLVLSGLIVHTTYTVATLPSAIAGGCAFVSDSTSTLAAGIGNTVTGGGSNFVPVYSDGTYWIIG